jgi:hypothetical protein
MSKTRWRHISTLPDDGFMDDILVWNDCNGPHYATWDQDGPYWKLKQENCWTMWREIPPVTEAELEIAGRIAKREGMPPPARPLPP